MSGKREAYKVKRIVDYSITPEMVDLMRRRTMPFLDWAGLSTRPLPMLLQEAYLQGLTDGVDAMNDRECSAYEAQTNTPMSKRQL